MNSPGTLNIAWATTLIEGLVAAGVGHAVISPGSRSTPLALACLRHPTLVSKILLDERAAAFFALGLAKAGGRPVVLICTSGSAVSNWHPAVTEADSARLPLILLSSDRPPELQDCGANQTVAQQAVFGAQLRAFHALPPAEDDPRWLGNFAARVVSQSLWPLPGPVQVNLPFREPLLPAAPAKSVPPVPVKVPRVVLPRLAPPDGEIADLASRLQGRRGVILAGIDPQPVDSLTRLAAALDWPILADPLSGLRFGPHDRSRVITRADTFLRGMAPRPDWVLRFGAFPVSKPIATWLAACGAGQVTISADSRWPDPQRAADVMIHGDFAMVADGLAQAVRQAAPADWIAEFFAAERRVDGWLKTQAPVEAAVIETAVGLLPDGALLFVGNSMAIRDFDSFSGSAGKRLTVLCNRGASGIDGNLATFFGAVASGCFSAALAILGDLSFLHDLGGLASGQGQNASLLVLDNAGGAIFNYLPQANLPEFKEGWLTPQTADFAAAAKVWGHGFRQIDDHRVLAPALAAALGEPGLSILRLALDGDASIARHRALWDAARSLKEIIR